MYVHVHVHVSSDMANREDCSLNLMGLGRGGGVNKRS